MKVYYNSHRWIHEDEARTLAEWIGESIDDVLKSLLGEYKYKVVG